jgi:TatD DNase family protein
VIYTDTHTHLYASEFEADRSNMLHRAFDEGVRRIFLPNIDSSSIDAMLDLEAKHPTQCHAMMGLHPCSVKENYKEELALVEDWWIKRDFCAVGEIGMDLYWDKTFVKEQEDAFRFQIQLAVAKQRPFVIHCRDAFDEIFKVLESEPLPEIPGIFHCFTGNLEQAERAIKLGFVLGIGGVVTFKNGGLDKVLPYVGLEHLVLETDAPYLAPVPYRGKRNETSYITFIAEKIAELKECSLEEVAYATTQNSKRIFGM